MVSVIVPCAGLGRRLGGKKPFIPILGKPLFIWTLSALSRVSEVSDIVPVFSESDMERALKLIEQYSVPKIKRIAKGGPERQDSVRNGLSSISNDTEIVLIHDGARPCIEEEVIYSVIRGLKGFDGAIAAVPIKDTIKEASEELVIKTLNRDRLWAAQTPQGFLRDTIIRAYERAEGEGFSSTDDSSLVERYGGKIKIVMGSYCNIKVTTPEDIAIAEFFLKGAGQ